MPMSESSWQSFSELLKLLVSAEAVSAKRRTGEAKVLPCDGRVNNIHLDSFGPSTLQAKQSLQTLHWVHQKS